MPGFFAPSVRGRDGAVVELNADLREWRGYVARVASTYGSSLEQIAAWPWPELLAWWAEATFIHDEGIGLLARLLAGRPT